ncbi:MAG: PIN domain-containing protein [Polyangiales bacterium]
MPGYLFDTDAVSEVLKPKPADRYVSWLKTLPVELQFTSAITVAELFWGAHRSKAKDRHLDNIRRRVLPALTVLSFDAKSAERFGAMKAELEAAGTPLDDADLQIASIAMTNDLELVTGNVKHFLRVPGLRLNTTLAATRTT